jgi:hypothetical protein
MMASAGVRSKLLQRRGRPFACLALVVSVAAGCGKPAPPPNVTQGGKIPIVTCDLHCEWTADGLIANLTFKNTTPTTNIRLLKRNLLMGEEATQPTWSPFEIIRNSVRIPFSGKGATPPKPTEADYHQLAPGDSVTATVNVGSAYDLSKPGTYRLRYECVNFSPDVYGRIDIASNWVDIEKPAGS